MSARIKILLEDGDRAPIWVTVYPVTHSYATSAIATAGEAAAAFIASLARDEEALEKWLSA